VQIVKVDDQGMGDPNCRLWSLRGRRLRRCTEEERGGRGQCNPVNGCERCPFHLSHHGANAQTGMSISGTPYKDQLRPVRFRRAIRTFIY
jgi:hypothetical protein